MASLPESPWSGDYWAIYKGILGNRFLDRSHSYLSDWKEYFDYVNENQFFSIFQTGNKEAINQLSVSEKYDLLIGDQSGSFTFAMWDQGRDYYDRDGTVETWMGICHGWAAATVMVARPTKSVQALAFDGKTILNFNPSELKGLLSYLWANGDFETRFVGGRCNLKDVKRDEVGRPLAKECFDTNPATWYITAVNQIGIARRGFVMDVTPDYEVWNQPVYSYSVKYFNPQSLKASETLVGAIVNRADYSKDKFKKYRAANSTQIVGIEMSIQYTVEETANSSETDEPANDNLRTVKYLFDLELDAGGKIIGGEWYESNHPDFMWVPEKQAVASVTEDSYLDPAQWNGYDVLPPLWQKVGKSAAKNRNVLGSVTNKLIQRAQ